SCRHDEAAVIGALKHRATPHRGTWIFAAAPTPVANAARTQGRSNADRARRRPRRRFPRASRAVLRQTLQPKLTRYFASWQDFAISKNVLAIGFSLTCTVRSISAVQSFTDD